MAYKSLQHCISDLDNKGELKIISTESNPDLEMASIHLDEFAKNGKAILFENVKGSQMTPLIFKYNFIYLLSIETYFLSVAPE